MRLNRLLRYLNVLVAVLLVVALAAAWWIAYRVLPKTSGEIEAPISRSANIKRDARGVPHITAESIEDALFLQGYVTAQDRLWQMDALRRFAAGELSEVIGKDTINVDRETRKLRMRRIAEEHYKRLNIEDRAYMAAYARGVSYFIETHLGSLPLEFALLGYQPRPWTVVDSILVGLHMFRDLTNTWQDEDTRRKLLAGGKPELVEMLYPKRTGAEFQPGSNAWAVSGTRTASGKPILANDPHLDFAIPSPWYLVHLQAADLNVAGATLAGAPGVIIGHNDKIAWGVTNLHYDVQDLYIEKFNRQTGQYLFRGQVLQARPERELILVKGEKPVEFVNWVSQHGPLWSQSGPESMFLKWAAAEPGVFEFPFIRLNAAQNWDEFKQALARFPGPGQNFVYADVDGNIGYHAAGKLPIRKNYDGDLPVDGSSGDFEWEGFIPFDELPSAYNPASGIVITANQNPFPADYKHRVNGNFAPHYRARQIRDMLSTRAKGWKPEDMLTIQKDVYSGFSHFLARQLVGAWEKRGKGNASLTEAAEILRSWNGQMEKGQPAPLLITLAYQHLRRMMAEKAAPGKGSLYEYSMAGPVLERLLRERPSAWYRDFDQFLLEAFSEAVEEGQRLQGRNLRKWDYGVYIELRVKQPVGGAIPVIGPYFNIGPFPMSGSSTTVKQTTRRLGPSMRMVANTADWDETLQNITLGQSGQFLSWHYKDQWEEYYAGKGIPFRFERIEGRMLTVVPLKK